MTIEITGLRIDPVLRSRIVTELDAVLERERSSPVGALVAFFDDDGPKNGPAVRCAVTIRRPRRAPIHVEERDRSRRLAFDAAFATVARRLREEAGRARDLRRRPKKYFLARKLLTSGTGAR